tara:strand:+ start:43 stop:858 length:816 start_codon:yes stop_codon:yes gene_type:complete
MTKELLLSGHRIFPILLFTGLPFWSCQDSQDSNQQNAAIIGSWNFVSENGFSDYECTEPNDEDELNLPGASINGMCNISENEITQSISYEVTKEWMCAIMDGILLDDGNTCTSDTSGYYYGYSVNMDDFAEEICQDLLDQSSNGIWNATTGTCSMVQNDFATYTLNSDATLMYLIRGECDCESGDCYSESEVECNSFGGEWVIEDDTLEILMRNETLTLTDKDRWDGDFCDCEDSNDNNCNSDLNESECANADGYYDKGGEDCHITTYTKN